MRHLASITLLACVLAISPRAARAELMISFDPNPTIAPNSTGLINVYISSNADSLTPDQFNTAAYEFVITTTGASRLEFTDSTSQPTAFLGNSSYIFFGDSVAAVPPPSPVGGRITDTTVSRDTYAGGDQTFSFAPVSLSLSDGKKLLVQLQVVTSAVLPPAPNDTFLISLVPRSGSGTLGDPAMPNTTFFDTQDIDANESSFVGFTSTPGTVTVAVPEPAAFASAFGGILLLGGYGYTRRPRADRKMVA